MKVKAAVAQVMPAFVDHDRTLAIAVDAITEAARNGATVVSFSEGWFPGFPVWIFASSGWNDAKAQNAYAHLFNNAIEIPGPATVKLCETARKHGINVVMGVSERESTYSRGTLYDTLLFISDKGELLGRHRKLKPTHVERTIWGEGDGSGLRVYDTNAGRIGGSLCWEHWMPLPRYTLHSLGEQIHVAAWPHIPEDNVIASRHYAIEGRCFVLASGTYLSRSKLPAKLPVPMDWIISPSRLTDNQDSILEGGSGIIGPNGKWLSGPIVGQEAIIYAELDMDDITRGKLTLDTGGHYNRTDIFNLTVDRRTRAPLMTDDGGNAQSSGAASNENGSIRLSDG